MMEAWVAVARSEFRRNKFSFLCRQRKLSEAVALLMFPIADRSLILLALLISYKHRPSDREPAIILQIALCDVALTPTQAPISPLLRHQVMKLQFQWQQCCNLDLPQMLRLNHPSHLHLTLHAAVTSWEGQVCRPLDKHQSRWKQLFKSWEYSTEEDKGLISTL